jgi:hypothetical protein
MDNVINLNKVKAKKFNEENEIVFTLDDDNSDASNDNGMEFIFEMEIDDA